MFDYSVSPAVAFDNAIANGVLSADINASNFAGNFMYMGEANDGKHVGSAFKNIIAREYIYSHDVKEARRHA